MPDPLCRLHGLAVAADTSTREEDSAQRLIAPEDARAFRKALGHAVRHVRGVAGLSQESLGHTAGLHRNYVGSIERGEINLTLRVLHKLAFGLRVPASDLLVVAERLANGSKGHERRR